MSSLKRGIGAFLLGSLIGCLAGGLDAGLASQWSWAPAFVPLAVLFLATGLGEGLLPVACLGLGLACDAVFGSNLGIHGLTTLILGALAQRMLAQLSLPRPALHGVVAVFLALAMKPLFGAVSFAMSFQRGFSSLLSSTTLTPLPLTLLFGLLIGTASLFWSERSYRGRTRR